MHHTLQKQSPKEKQRQFLGGLQYLQHVSKACHPTHAAEWQKIVAGFENAKQAWMQTKEFSNVALHAIPAFATLISAQKNKEDILSGKLKENDLFQRLEGRDFDGYTFKKFLHTAKLLGSDPNFPLVMLPSLFGGIPQTHVAASGNHYLAFRTFVQNGGRMDIQDTLGRYPIHYAFMGRESAAESAENKAESKLLAHFMMLNTQKIRELAVQKTQDINLSTHTGDTALHLFAADQRNTDESSFLLLLQRGADLNLQNDQGQTPLHRAAISKNLRVYEYLLTQGANPQIRDQQNHTPTAYLSKIKRLEIRNISIESPEKSIRNKENFATFSR